MAQWINEKKLDTLHVDEKGGRKTYYTDEQVLYKAKAKA